MTKFGVCFMVILLCQGKSWGFMPFRPDYHIHTGGRYGDIFGSHTIISKRDVTPSSGIIPGAVQDLITKIVHTLGAAQTGVSVEDLQQAMADIAHQAGLLLQQAGVTVSEQDINAVLTQLSPNYRPLLKTAMNDETPKLHLALELMERLAVALELNTDEIYATVGAVQKTAGDVENIVEDIKQVFTHLVDTFDSKRQTTVGGHVEHGPGDTSGGVSASHTWSHGGGSSTTVGGHVNHGPGGTSGGISVTHTFGRRFITAMEKRQTTWGTHINHGPWGTSGGISGSHTTPGGTTYGGHVDYDPSGYNNAGISASHTWNHGGGSSTTLGGHVDHSNTGGLGGGISISHTFG